jgi:hypothetical protein
MLAFSCSLVLYSMQCNDYLISSSDLLVFDNCGCNHITCSPYVVTVTRRRALLNEISIENKQYYHVRSSYMHCLTAQGE